MAASMQLLLLGLFVTSLADGNPVETSPSDADYEQQTVRFEIDPFLVTPDQILVKNVDSMLRILPKKGEFFKKLTFSGDQMSVDQALGVCHRINQYTSNTLVDLSLGGEHLDYLICDAPQPFSHLQSLTIFSKEISCELKLDKIFPEMESLTFLAPSEKLIPSLERKYQHMKYLTFQQLKPFSDNENLHALVRANPQIHGLSLDSVPGIETLIILGEHLPELHVLCFDCELNGCYQETTVDGFVHMYNVDKFVLATGLNPNITALHIPIIFDNLQFLEIDGKYISDAGIQLIERHPGLLSLELPLLYEAKDFVRVWNVVGLLPALRQIILPWWPHWDFGILYQLLELETLDVVRIRMEFDADHSTFVSKIPRKWQLKEATEVPMYDKRGVELRFARPL